MADRELAAKLLKRLASIEPSDACDSSDTAGQILSSTLPTVHSNEIVQQCSSLLNIDETVDIDEFIVRTLDGQADIKTLPSVGQHDSINQESNISLSHETKKTPSCSIINLNNNCMKYSSRLLEEKNGATISSYTISEASEIRSQDDSSRTDSPSPVTLSKGYNAPVVSIVYHKCKNTSNSLQSNKELFEERNELEVKLAKQRAIKCQTVDLGITSTKGTNDSYDHFGELCMRRSPATPIKPSPPVLSRQYSAPMKSFTSSQSAAGEDGEVDSELALKLARRNRINEGELSETNVIKWSNLYIEFSEFSRETIQHFIKTFKIFDEDEDSFIDFNELKRMMERLGEAQTHVALKQILKQVDEDQDGKVNLREFLLIFRYARNGSLSCSNVFNEIAASINVSREGVISAANFFETKIKFLNKDSEFIEEIKAEREEKKKNELLKQQRREKFLARKEIFQWE